MTTRPFDWAFDESRPPEEFEVSLEIRLIGVPSVHDDEAEPYRPRSRKTWALLAFLTLSTQPPSRSRLASLLFDQADDPLRALRWCLSELRRLIGPDGTVGGNPVKLSLPSDSNVDVDRITRGEWTDALSMNSIDRDLLEGFEGLGSPEFTLWLFGQRRRIQASAEAIAHEAVLAWLGKGDFDRSIPMAESMVARNSYDERHQALLIRAYAMAGDQAAAQRQLRACTKMFVDELGVSPGPSVRAAALAGPATRKTATEPAAVEAAIESGLAAMTAGAAESGLIALRSGVALANSLEDPSLRARSRIALADALVHSVRGEDEEGALLLHEAAHLAAESHDDSTNARARIELGFIDMLGARYDRATIWLGSAAKLTTDPQLLGRAYGYLGVVESDRSNYETAEALLQDAVELARVAGDQRREAYVISMLGRAALLRGDLDSALPHLERAVELAQEENWLAFLPWPQAFMGEALVEFGDLEGARSTLEQAFARACQIGDPCWEGVSGRGLAMLAEAEGKTLEAFEIIDDAAERCVRLSDTYRWGEAYVLEARCRLGIAHDHDKSGEWVETLYELAASTGMRELAVRALVYRSRIQEGVDLEAVGMLAGEIANRRLREMIEPRPADEPLNTQA